MKSLVLLLLLPLVGLLCSCSGGKEPGQPVAAAFEYGESSGKATQAPIYVLYDDGTLLFRKRNANRFDYLKLELLEAEQAELMAHIESVVRDPGLKERFTLSPDAPTKTGTAFVFFAGSASVVAQVDDLKAIEVSALRLGESPDFSGDSSFPNSLIQHILTMGMLRISAADEWKSGSSDLEHLFPGQERWSALKFETAKDSLIKIRSDGPGSLLNKEAIKEQFKTDLKSPMKVTP